MAALIFGFGQGAYVAVFTIADGDIFGLISAMNTAETNNEDDVINLATGGSYILTAVNNTVGGENGLPPVTADNGHSLTINGNGNVNETFDPSSLPYMKGLTQ